MKKKIEIKTILYVLFLLFFPAMTIELYSGSTPPINYFTPLVLLFFAIAYGLPFILIREAKIRWNLTWQFMFLFPIVGIFIEGIFMQSFFNTAHADLGNLSALGMWYHVQWPWTIYLIIMHGIYSVAYPLLITDILFPKFRNKTVLTKKTIIISFILILLLTALQFTIITIDDQPMYANYDIHILGTIICVAVVGLLVALAYAFRNYKWKQDLFRNRKRDHGYSFLYLVLLLLGTHFFAEIHVILVLVAQAILTFILIKFAVSYIYTSQRTANDLVPLINGATLHFSALGIMQEVGWIPNQDPPQGMMYVGLGFLVLAVIVNIKAYMNRKKSSKKMSESVEEKL